MPYSQDRHSTSIWVLRFGASASLRMTVQLQNCEPANLLFLRIDLVAADDAVLDIDDAVSIAGDVMFVSHQDDGVSLGVELIEQTHDLFAGLRIQVPGGLVGEVDGRVI